MTETDPYSDETLTELAETDAGSPAAQLAGLLLKFPAHRRRDLYTAGCAGTTNDTLWWKVYSYLSNAYASQELDAVFPRDTVAVPDAYLSARYLLAQLARGIGRVVRSTPVTAAGTEWHQMGDVHVQGGDAILLVYRDGNGCDVHVTLTAAITKVETQ